MISEAFFSSIPLIDYYWAQPSAVNIIDLIFTKSSSENQISSLFFKVYV